MAPGKDRAVLMTDNSVNPDVWFSVLVTLTGVFCAVFMTSAIVMYYRIQDISSVDTSIRLQIEEMQQILDSSSLDHASNSSPGSDFQDSHTYHGDSPAHYGDGEPMGGEYGDDEEMEHLIARLTSATVKALQSHDPFVEEIERLVNGDHHGNQHSNQHSNHSDEDNHSYYGDHREHEDNRSSRETRATVDMVEFYTNIIKTQAQYIIDMCDNENDTCDAGDKGDKGEAGGQGPIGPQGAQGAQGLKGENGDMGPDGVNGTVGDQGPKGADGQKGNRGPDGEHGLKGYPGVDGSNGTDGDNGTKGVPGDTGEKGVNGTVGEQGPHGDPGVNGTVGVKGEVGDPGFPGVSGQAGINITDIADCDLDQCTCTLKDTLSIQDYQEFLCNGTSGDI